MIRAPIAPMLAHAEEHIPKGDYLYEPKWDGFRTIVFKDGAKIVLQSRNFKPLNRYFPELVRGLARVLPRRCVVDGEIVIATPAGLDFDALLQRVHPAASRIAKLAEETPASFVAFDLLALGEKDLRKKTFAERRARLSEALTPSGPLFLTPSTRDYALARRWFLRFEGAGLDGVIAKPLDLPYVSGERVLTKIKHQRSADCVIGGYREGKDGHGLNTLWLGLYRRAHLVHVGAASGMKRAVRAELEALLRPLRTDDFLQSKQTRWNSGTDPGWIALKPKLVVEVAYDHMQAERFRHVTRFLRLRPDREPRSCTFSQLETVTPTELAPLLSRAHVRT